MLRNDAADLAKFLYYCTMKVHRLMCLELKKYIDRISSIFPVIESARPRCTTGIQAMCSLQIAMEKANLLILHCSESSKLFLAITGDKILLRCERIRQNLELYLSQIQKMVPPLLAAQISRTVDDLKVATFTMEPSEDEAGNVLLALIHQDIAATNSVNVSELKALQLAALRLHITSPVAVLMEKRSIRSLLAKNHDRSQTNVKILNYLLYLVRKYGKSIARYQTESIVRQHEESLSQFVESVSHADNSGEWPQVGIFDTAEPPEEFKCPLSTRLMYDPVIIANGQTFERVWIEKWFNEGHETCPKTHTQLPDLNLTPNHGVKDLISSWCTKQGIIVQPCPQPTNAGHRLQKLSSSVSTASFGSTIKGLRLQISNVSFRSSDTDCSFNLLDANTSDGLGIDIPHMNSNSQKFRSSINSHGINLSFLSKLAALPWASQCKAVEDVKNQMKDYEEGSHSMISNSYIKPLIRFLKDARDRHDSKALRDGARLLLTFLVKIRNEVPSLQEDAIYVLSSFLDSEITKEALAIMEIVSIQQHYKSLILASGVLPSILEILDKHTSEWHLPAMKILHNLSVNSDIAHHMVYLDFIPKLAPFLDDHVVAGYCIKILRNLCKTEEAMVAIAECNTCISSLEELLEIGTSEEQEDAADILLCLCHQCAENCKMIKDDVIQCLVHMSLTGSDKGKLVATDLLQLVSDFTNGYHREVSIQNDAFEIDISHDSGDHPKQKKGSKAFGFLGRRKKSIFPKPRQ